MEDMSACKYWCGMKTTDCGNADTPVLKRQIKGQLSWKKVQDLARLDEAGFATTDAFKVPNENEAVTGSHDREISAIPGYMSYQRINKSESSSSDFRARMEWIIRARGGRGW